MPAVDDTLSTLDYLRQFLGLPTGADTAQRDPLIDPSQVLTPDRSGGGILASALGLNTPSSSQSAQALGYPPDVLTPEPGKSRRNILGEMGDFFSQGTGRGPLNFNLDLGGKDTFSPTPATGPTYDLGGNLVSPGSTAVPSVDPGTPLPAPRMGLDLGGNSAVLPAGTPSATGTIDNERAFDADGNSLMTPAQIDAMSKAMNVRPAPSSGVSDLVRAAMGISPAFGGEGAPATYTPPGMGTRLNLPPTGATPAAAATPATPATPAPVVGPSATAPIGTGPMSPAGQAELARLKAVAAPSAGGGMSVGGAIANRAAQIANAAVNAPPPDAARPFVAGAKALQAGGPAAAAAKAVADATPGATAPPATQPEATTGYAKPNPDGPLAGELPPGVQASLANHGVKLPGNTWDFLIQLGAGMMAHADKPGMQGVGLALQDAYNGMTAQQQAAYNHSIELLKINAQVSDARAKLAVTASNNQLSHEDRVAAREQNEQLKMIQLGIMQQNADNGLQFKGMIADAAKERADAAVANASSHDLAVRQQADANFQKAYQDAESRITAAGGTAIRQPGTDDAVSVRALSSMATGGYGQRPEVQAALTKQRQIDTESRQALQNYPNTLVQINQRREAYGLGPLAAAPR